MYLAQRSEFLTNTLSTIERDRNILPSKIRNWLFRSSIEFLKIEITILSTEKLFSEEN